jgi:hypothetical protein
MGVISQAPELLECEIDITLFGYPRDNCRYFVLYGPVRSSQVRLGRDSVESGLVRFSRAWWNDRENDHLSKQ